MVIGMERVVYWDGLDGDDLETIVAGIWVGMGIRVRGRSGMGIDICPRAALYCAGSF